MSNIELLEKTLPAAPLKLIAMESCRELGQKVNDYIWMNQEVNIFYPDERQRKLIPYRSKKDVQPFVRGEARLFWMI